jgi:SOS-response transcriptional repressor LexA
LKNKQLYLTEEFEEMAAGHEGEPPWIAAGFPDDLGDGCVRLDPHAVLRATPRSFAMRVRGQSMFAAGIEDGDVVVGEFTPQARTGAIIVALIDGESALKRLVMHEGRPQLASENPDYPDFVPLSELVIQGVVHTVVKRITNDKLQITENARDHRS